MHDDVVAGLTRQKFRLDDFGGVVNIIINVDAIFSFEVRNCRFADVVSPIENIKDFFLLSADRPCNKQGCDQNYYLNSVHVLYHIQATFGERPRNNEALDFTRTFPDSIDSELATETFRTVFTHIAAAAENLYSTVGDSTSGLGSV